MEIEKHQACLCPNTELMTHTPGEYSERAECKRSDLVAYRTFTPQIIVRILQTNGKLNIKTDLLLLIKQFEQVSEKLELCCYKNI